MGGLSTDFAAISGTCPPACISLLMYSRYIDQYCRAAHSLPIIRLEASFQYRGTKCTRFNRNWKIRKFIPFGKKGDMEKQQA